MKKSDTLIEVRLINWEDVEPKFEKMLSDHEERIIRIVKYSNIPKSMSLSKAGEMLGKSFPVIKRMIREKVTKLIYGW